MEEEGACRKFLKSNDDVAASCRRPFGQAMANWGFDPETASERLGHRSFAEVRNAPCNRCPESERGRFNMSQNIYSEVCTWQSNRPNRAIFGL